MWIIWVLAGLRVQFQVSIGLVFAPLFGQFVCRDDLPIDGGEVATVIPMCDPVKKKMTLAKLIKSQFWLVNSPLQVAEAEFDILI